LAIFFSIVFIVYYYGVPRPLFDVSYSTVVESSSGKLLGARIAADQQWRFPLTDSVLKSMKMPDLF
jgi:penicillin-binding protein 1C